MSLIEQAAKRLEQLRQAGVELPEDADPRLGMAKTLLAMPENKVLAEIVTPPQRLKRYGKERITLQALLQVHLTTA